MKIFIEDIADKMEEANEDWQAFLNKKSGEIVDIGHQYYGIAEELREDEEIPTHLADWEKEFVQTAIKVVENWENYVELPNQFDIHEYSIMEDFVESITNHRKRAILYQAMNGRGAYRRFKDKLYDLGLEESWFAYKYNVFCKIAVRWCDEYKISYEFKDKRRGLTYVNEKRNDTN
jgi:hypothetical protein